MKYDIFVSYRRTDRELVAQIVRKLESRGVGVWYDADVSGGGDFTDEIVKALQASEMLVIFFSEACNSSKHLKRELLVADKLSKPVVPILIEDTEPKGGYLYLLSDRNWIKAFPDPETKIDELVEHLSILAGKDGGLSGKPSALKRAAPPPPAAGAPAPAPEAPMSAPAPDAEPELPPLFGDGVQPAPASGGKVAPITAKAYVGRTSALGGKDKPLNDILPFKWIDLLFLVPGVGAFLWWISGDMKLENATEMVIALSILGLTVVSLYGAVVFPVRYFLRRRSIRQALGAYLASTLILFGLSMGSFLIAKTVFRMFPYDDPVEMLAIFGSATLVFAIIAFVIYGILAGQRALRSFRSNLKKIA
jgi:hypothetical protein